jgi:hypothetical protein
MRRVSPLVSSGVVLLACTALLLPHCASPTALTIAVYSDISCDKRPIAGLAVGSSMDEVRGKAFSSTSLGCAPDGKLGSVVVYPSAGAKNGRVAVQVVTRVDGEDPATCSPANAYKGCIVAKRELRLVPNQDLQMRIDLRKSCEGIPCDEASTCVRGACVTAIVGCNGVCTEAEIPGAPALVPPAIPDDASADAVADVAADTATVASDVGVDAGAIDSAVANTPFCNGWTYCDDFEGGGNITWELYKVGNASIAVVGGIANSGTKAVRHQRPVGGPGAVNEASFYFTPQYSPAHGDFLTCEYDVYYASDIPSGTTDHHLSGFRMLGLTGGYSEFQAGIVSANLGGFNSRWFTVKNGVFSGVRSLNITSARKNTWYTVTSKVLVKGGAVGTVSTDIKSNLGSNSTGYFFTPVSYGSNLFGIGVYEEGASLVSDVYFDNVRCR